MKSRNFKQSFPGAFALIQKCPEMNFLPKERKKCTCRSDFALFENPNASTKALVIAQNHLEIFTDQYDRKLTYINNVIARIDSKKAQEELTKLYYEHVGSVPSQSALASALAVHAASSNTEQHFLNLRFNKSKEGYFIDSASKKGEEFLVNKEGVWKLLPTVPRFNRYGGEKEWAAEYILELEEAKELLSDFLNLFSVDQDTKYFLSCYLIASLVSDIPIPMVLFYGPEGSGKSTSMKLIKMILDPSATPKITFPKDLDDLALKLGQNRVCPFDNVSYINAEQSDFLCIAITKGSYTKRQLFTDEGKISVQLDTRVLMTARNVVATASDLLRRTILARCICLSDTKTVDEKSIYSNFERLAPRVRGALLHFLHKAISKVEAIHKYSGSMPDFSKWAEAASQVLGHKPGTFLEKYNKNVNEQSQESIESHVLGDVLLKFLEENPLGGEWGTSFLLEKLESLASEKELKQKQWPKTPHHFSRKLVHLVRPLMVRGWQLETGIRTNRERKIRISNLASLASQESLKDDRIYDTKYDTKKSSVTETDANDTNDAKISIVETRSDVKLQIKSWLTVCQDPVSYEDVLEKVPGSSEEMIWELKLEGGVFEPRAGFLAVLR